MQSLKRAVRAAELEARRHARPALATRSATAARDTAGAHLAAFLQFASNPVRKHQRVAHVRPDLPLARPHQRHPAAPSRRTYHFSIRPRSLSATVAAASIPPCARGQRTPSFKDRGVPHFCLAGIRRERP